MLWFLLGLFAVIAWFTKGFWDNGELLGALVGGFALLVIGIFGFNVAVAEAKAAFCSSGLTSGLPMCRAVYTPHPGWPSRWN